MTDWEHSDLENKIGELRSRIENLEYDLRRAMQDLESDIRQKADKHHDHSE